MKRFMKGLMTAGMVAVLATSAFAKTASIKVSDKEMKLDISGFVQAAYITNQGNNTVNGSVIGIGDYALNPAAQPGNSNDTFTINRAQVNFTAQPSDNIMIKTTAELGRNFNTAINDSRIVDAIIDLSYFKPVTLRVGQFATPFGTEIEKSPYDLDFVNYSLLTTLMAKRTRGAMIYGDITENVSFDLGVSNQLGNGSLTGAGNELSSDSSAEFGRLSIVPVENLKFDLSIGYQKYWDGTIVAASKIKTKDTIIALDGAYTYMGWGFEAAYAEMKDVAPGAGGVSVTQKDRDLYGAITFKIPETSLQLVTRYERNKMTDSSSPAGTVAPVAKVLTAGINWNFDKNARLQLQREFWSSDVSNVNENDLSVLQLGVSF